MMMISNMSFGSLPMMNTAPLGYGNPQSPLYSNLGMNPITTTARTGVTNPYSNASAGLNGQVQTGSQAPSLRQQSQDAYTSVMNTLNALQQRSGSGGSTLSSPSPNISTLGFGSGSNGSAVPTQALNAGNFPQGSGVPVQFGSGSNGSAVPTQALNTGNFPQGSGVPVQFGSGSNGSAVPTQALNTGNFPQGSGVPVQFGSGSNGSAVPTGVNNTNSFSQTAANSYQNLTNSLTALNSPQAQQQGQVYSTNPFQIGFDVNGTPLSATDSLNQTLGLATGGSLSIPTATGSFGGNTAAAANFGVQQQPAQLSGASNNGNLLNGLNLGGSVSSGGASSLNNDGSVGLAGLNLGNGASAGSSSQGLGTLATSGNVATMASHGNASIAVGEPNPAQPGGMQQTTTTPRTGHAHQGGDHQNAGQTFHSSGRTLHIPNMARTSAQAQAQSPSQVGGNCQPGQRSGNATQQTGNQYWPPQGAGHTNGLQTPQVGRPTGGSSGAVAASTPEEGTSFSQIQAFNQRNGAGKPYEVRNEDTGFNYTTVQPQTHAGLEMSSGQPGMNSNPWHNAWNSVKASAASGMVATGHLGGQAMQGLQSMASGFQSMSMNLGSGLGNFFGGGFGG